jgi:hypothetical protein
MSTETERAVVAALSRDAKSRRFGLRDAVAMEYTRHGFLLALEEVADALARLEGGRIVAQEVGPRRANVRPRGHTYEGGEARG